MSEKDSNNLERVVYLLGAGCSAGLGLPVMADFLEKSKDLYFSDSDRYAHFEKVFKFIVITLRNYGLVSCLSCIDI